MCTSCVQISQEVKTNHLIEAAIFVNEKGVSTIPARELASSQT